MISNVDTCARTDMCVVYSYCSKLITFLVLNHYCNTCVWMLVFRLVALCGLTGTQAWTQYVPLKPTSPHDVSTQKTNMGMFTVVMSSDLMFIFHFSAVTVLCDFCVTKNSGHQVAVECYPLRNVTRFSAPCLLKKCV